MKIYFIGQKGIPAIFGGIERHVEELAVKLANSGHEVYAYTRPHYTPADLKEYKGIKLISIKSLATKRLDTISHTFRACLDLRKRNPDIIHFHSIGPSSLIWLVRLLKPGVPVIATFHSKCYLHDKWGIFARFYLKLGEFFICKLPHKTITISLSLTQYVKAKYNILPVYIPNGVAAFENVKAQEIKKWGLEDGNYILAVSRLVKNKGIHYLIEAYKQIKTDKKLVIVGGGVFTDDYVNKLKKSAEGNKNIIFTDNQSGQILAELFSNACFFIHPSESEGLSLALLEAMSYKKAALVSDIPENIEAIGCAEFTFENKNANDLREKMEFLLNNPVLAQKRGVLNKERVIKFYSWENIAKETVKVYENALMRLNKKEKISTLANAKKVIAHMIGF